MGTSNRQYLASFSIPKTSRAHLVFSFGFSNDCTEFGHLQRDPTRKVNLYEILSELRMLIVSACLPLLAGILIALAPVMVYYMIKLSWDKERSLSDNLEMMWRPPASADSKPNSNEDAPPTPSQPENVDQPPIDPSPKEIEKEYV